MLQLFPPVLPMKLLLLLRVLATKSIICVTDTCSLANRLRSTFTSVLPNLKSVFRRVFVKITSSKLWHGGWFWYFAGTIYPACSSGNDNASNAAEKNLENRADALPDRKTSQKRFQIWLHWCGRTLQTVSLQTHTLSPLHWLSDFSQILVLVEMTWGTFLSVWIVFYVSWMTLQSKPFAYFLIRFVLSQRSFKVFIVMAVQS